MDVQKSQSKKRKMNKQQPGQCSSLAKSKKGAINGREEIPEVAVPGSRTVKEAKKKLKVAETCTSNQGDTASVQAFENQKLPLEMLEQIFLKLDKSEDFSAVINSCPSFNDLMSREKTTRLFSLAFPFMFPKLSQTDTLSCREVCKTWGNAVDNFLQNHGLDQIAAPYHSETTKRGLRPDHYPSHETNLVSKDFYGLRLCSNVMIKEMNRDFEGHNGNPFVLRRVCFEDSGSINYWNHVYRFLAKYGQHIYHTTLFTECTRDQPGYFFNYKMLCRTLALMPNLRTLCVCGFHSVMDTITDDDGEDVAMEQDNYLASIIQKHPLPEMLHLHTIEDLMSGAFYRQPLLAAMLSKYSSQLRKFTTPMCTWSHAVRCPVSFQLMTELCIKFNENCPSWRPILLTLNAPHLAKIKLNAWLTCEISDILDPLQHNFPSLVYLQLVIRGDLHKCLVPSSFRLEKIKTLQIMDTKQVCYDQLLRHLPALEYMLVTNNNFSEQICLADEEVEIRKWMHSDSMYESNVWLKLRSLKQFIFGRLGNTGDTENEVVSMKRYYREVYEKLVAEKAAAKKKKPAQRKCLRRSLRKR